MNSRYVEEFKKLHRETFKLNEQVYIMNPEIIRQNKRENRYEKEGVIKRILENDSYLVESEGKIFKRNHYTLKKKN